MNLDDLEKITGGYVVDDSEENKFWIIRQDGTVIAPAPTMEQAVEFAKAFNTSTPVITKENYRELFGRDLVW